MVKRWNLLSLAQNEDNLRKEYIYFYLLIVWMPEWHISYSYNQNKVQSAYHYFYNGIQIGSIAKTPLDGGPWQGYSAVQW